MLFQLYGQRRTGRLGAPASAATGQKGRTVSLPPPTGGWNVKDSLDRMKAGDAITLENWFNMPGRTQIRPGYTSWATGIDDTNDAVESLMPYNPASGSGKLFAATPSKIWDVTVSGAVGAASLSSLSNGRWQHINFATTSGNYLYIVNGADDPRYYNGTTWTTAAITGSGLTQANFIALMSHMNRLWFIEKSTRHVWYLPVQAITGGATLFDLSSLFTLGGELWAMDSWSRDGGDGPDDAAVFISNMGEVLVYSGTDPASDWSLVGRYRIPEPIGRRCTYKLGAELLILTTQGVMPMSQVTGLSVASQTNKSVSDKISGAFMTAYEEGGSYFGWQILEWPKAGMLVVNVPRSERQVQDQFVFSTRVGSWHPFKGLDASSWTLFGGDLYWGGNDGTVSRLGGYSDNGEPIVATLQQAFSNLGTNAVKSVTMARPRLISPVGYVPAVQIKTDFDTSQIAAQTVMAESIGAEWDLEDWDVADWGEDSVSTQAWQLVEGTGTTVSVAFKVSSNALVALNGTDLIYETGGFVGLS